jgi:signal transduction histidine kinase
MDPAARFGVSRWERLRTIDPRIRDTLLGVAALVVTLLATSVRDVTVDPDPVAVGLIVLGTLPLLLHRRAPIAVLAVIGAAGAAFALREGTADLAVPLAIAAYSAAARCDRRTVLAVALPIAVASAALITIGEGRSDNWVEVLVSLVPVPGVPLLLGRVTFNRRRRIQRDHVLAAREAVATERARIARELHDAVAHSMSVMVVQAGAARSVLASDAAAAAEALERVEATGRTGLAEMRRLLGVLTAGDDSPELAPQPGLARLDELLERVRAAGLPVERVVGGHARSLPPGVDLTAYRLVQEALTNALKHAGDAHARVTIRYGEDALELEVDDDGRGPPGADIAAEGHGLVGMRERVAMFNGSLETGPRPGGGFRVRARIPLEPAGGAAT